MYFSGGNSIEATPVPIPNTEVKLYSADGTAWEAVWESRTLPGIFFKPGINIILLIPGFFFNLFLGLVITFWAWL